VYNYLYAVARVGVDCSGFTYHMLEKVAGAYGIELDQVLGEVLGVPPREVRGQIGLWFLDPAQGYTEKVDDRIELLRPADLILFRGSDGAFKHSAIIQSVDLEKGIIRYLQSTDWATEIERGVHQSTIRFDPSRLGESLDHYSVRWLQQVRPPFTGEREPRNWRTDRDRYMWYAETGGSRVVRLRLLAAALAAAEPRFYSARFGRVSGGGQTACRPLAFLGGRHTRGFLDRPQHPVDGIPGLRRDGHGAVQGPGGQVGPRLLQLPAGGVQGGSQGSRVQPAAPGDPG
jgi:hypothetical protein